MQKLTITANGSQNIDANLNHPILAGDSTGYKANAPTREIEHTLEVWKGSEIDKEAYTYAGQLFRGNSCGQIYFKPQAETRNTQYLTYEKAHVEFELANNRWYMLSSPLKAVVAGDMYLPTIGGRQQTEAFNAITYKQGTNDRFSPAVYQRNWCKDNAEVWLPRTGSYKVDKSGNWSGAFNQVHVAYPAGEGFSIRPIYFENNAIAENHPVKFRLPKDDTSYSYYSYGDDTPDREITIERNNQNGKLATDGTEGTIVTHLAVNTGSRVFLAGNPFMATMDMDKFFEQNTSLKTEYIILTEQGQCVFSKNGANWISSISGIDGGTVAPMQGFFVTKRTDDKQVDVTYATTMTIRKPAQGSLLRAAQTRAEEESYAARLYVTAERKGFQSHIVIALQDGADNGYNEEEDVATLMDSNLKDAPNLYSVAGNTVAAINVIADQKRIPLGIYSENEEDVALTFNGVDSFGQSIGLYDAQTGTLTALNTGTPTVTVPGNTHGRYFISIGDEAGIENEKAISVYSPEANRIIVLSTSPNELLQQVSVYNTAGMEVKRLYGLDSMKEEITLPAGIYAVRIESANITTTAKVVVNGK